ncbi:subtilisin-like serine protease-like protein PR1A [Clohesyomyces aquaticus]|uniref:Subtilisin-like serine protease-like protein PR1A n=1 Tax=Clohesyomyces aquaticus TaxID=1231657 RepID=A0A1Y1Z1Z3_9PLEO|nr:subtilisin-like serine protease-like protein PR1A [Clohesyomyces aquaticus]
MRFSLLLAVLPLAIAAPVITPRAGQVIPGKYIIKMKNEAAQELLEAALAFLDKSPEHVYGFGKYKGFAAEMSDAIVKLVAALPSVEYIEKDAIVQHQVEFEPRAYVTQSSSTWGLGRISHVNKGISSYTYDSSAGTGTCSYVIDTGIYTSHPEFEGRATFLANYAGDGSNTDGNGHGTHVAGTIGSKTYGVAKQTKLYAVKVLDASGSGTNSGVIAGINFAANDQKTRSCPNGAVANMSLGGSKSTAVNSAAASAVSAGLFMGVAAGNEATNAANSSPASEPTVCTVGATDSSDNMASFSNYGSVVDVFAPGVSILSTWNNGGTNSISGTSMATPHVVGLAAYLLALEGKKSPAALCSRIQTLSQKSKITGIPSGTLNYLAFNGNPSG